MERFGILITMTRRRAGCRDAGFTWSSSARDQILITLRPLTGREVTAWAAAPAHRMAQLPPIPWATRMETGA